MSIYSVNILSVSKAAKGRNVKIKIFFVKIRLIHAHIFHEYYVRQAVGQVTKGRNVKKETLFSRRLFKIEV